MCGKVLLVLLLLSPLFLCAQDAELSLLLEAMKRLEDSDQHIANLNSDITSLRGTIAILSKDRDQLQQNNSALSRNNQRQQVELEMASANLRRQQVASQNQSLEYLEAIQKLSDSYNDILIASQDKDRRLSRATERNKIILLWAIIATLAAIAPLVIKKIKPW